MKEVLRELRELPLIVLAMIVLAGCAVKPAAPLPQRAALQRADIRLGVSSIQSVVIPPADLYETVWQFDFIVSNTAPRTGVEWSSNLLAWRAVTNCNKRTTNYPVTATWATTSNIPAHPMFCRTVRRF